MQFLSKIGIQRLTSNWDCLKVCHWFINRKKVGTSLVWIQTECLCEHIFGLGLRTLASFWFWDSIYCPEYDWVKRTLRTCKLHLVWNKQINRLLIYISCKILVSWGIKVKKTCFYFKLCSFLTTNPCGFLGMVSYFLPILPLLSSLLYAYLK